MSCEQRLAEAGESCPRQMQEDGGDLAVRGGELAGRTDWRSLEPSATTGCSLSQPPTQGRPPFV